MTLVSVIIPTRDRCALLAEALQSVRSQDLDGEIEVLVVDDRSSDGTAAMLRERFAEVRTLRLDEHIGKAAARNRALAVATGRFVAFLDDDDLWDPSYLRLQLAGLGERRAYAVARVLIWDQPRGTSRLYDQRADLDRYRSPLHQLFVDNFIYTTSSVVFPAALLTELDRFDPLAWYGCDVDLYLRAYLAGVRPLHTEALVTWRLHDRGQTNDTDQLLARTRLHRERVDRLHAAAAAHFDLPSRARLHAEIDARLASQFLRRRAPLRWAMHQAACLARGYPGLALANLRRDLGAAVEHLIGGQR